MKKNFILLAALMLSLFAHAQENEEFIAWQLIEQNKEQIGLKENELNNSFIKSAYFNKHGGTWLVHLQQKYLELPVHNQILVLAFKDEKLVSKTGTRVYNISQLAGNSPNPSIDAATAVKTALTSKGITEFQEEPAQQIGKKLDFGKLGVCSETVTAELMWVSVDEGQSVHLVWEIRVVPVKSSDYFMIRVDAKNNKVINEDNFTVSCHWGPTGNTSHANHDCEPQRLANQEITTAERPMGTNVVNGAAYLVVPYPAESPKHPGGTPDTVFSPWKKFNGNAVSLGWHTDGSGDYRNTRGNNVFSQLDNDDNNNTFGSSAQSPIGPDSLSFIFTPNFSQQTSTATNRNFALTNLFYWNNLAHNISYIHGFDERAGNFQTFNQGRGGAGNDQVIADCQDAGGNNNANFATPADGTSPRMQMYLWSNNIDGSLDNGVVTHEFMHGISNRLTGGPQASGCLQNAEQMGEGWSDYFSIMMTQNWAASDTNTGKNAPRAIGTYVSGQSTGGQGLRNVKYCTDWAINSKSFTRTLSSDKYDIGELWCSTLWDMTWNIIKESGKIDPTLFNDTGAGGNTVALKLVIEGMKYQPCSPGLIDGRNGILKADSIMYGGRYSCAIREAFRRRGMGFYASQGSSNSVSDQTPDYSNEIIVRISQNGTKEVPEGGTINYKVTALSPCANATGYKIRQTLPVNVTYLSGGNYDPASRTVSFDANLEAGMEKDFFFSVKINNGTYFPAYTLLDEKVPAAAISSNWSTTATPSTNVWRTSSSVSYSQPFSFYCQSLGVTADQKLFSPTISLPAGTYPRLSFRHRFSTENGWDGGVVEAFVNDSTWFNLENAFTENGYNGKLGPGSNPLANKRAFTGTITNFQKSVIDLSAYAGKTIKFRFWHGSDNSNDNPPPNPAGWFLDDLILEIAALVPMRTEVLNAGNVRVAFADTATYILQKPSCEDANIDQEPADKRICAGSSSFLTATIKGTDNVYQWQISTDKGQTFTNIPGATDDSLLLSSVTATQDSSLYRLIVSNACPSADTSTAAMIFVSESVSINNQPAGIIACEGSNASMQVSATGGVLGYQWQLSTDGVTFNDITGATDSIFDFSGIAGSLDSNLYRVKIISCNNVISSNSELIVINKAKINIQPEGGWACSGSIFYVSSDVTGDSLSHQWQVRPKGSQVFGDIQGSITDSLWINVNASIDSNTYRLIATNTCGSADTSLNAMITVSDSVFFSTEPLDITICNKLDTSMIVSVTGGRVDGYQWQSSNDGGQNYQDLIGQNSPTLLLQNVQVNQKNNKYRVIINACNSPVSRAALLNVLASPQIITGPQDAEVCENGNHTFNAVATGDGINYQWQISSDGGATYKDTGLDANSLTLVSVGLNKNNNLFRLITTGTCAEPDTSNLPATLKVNALIVPAFGSVTRNNLKKVCLGETKSPLPSADDNNVPGTWSPAFNGSQKTTYTFRPNNPCSKTDTLTVDVEGCRFITPNPVIAGQFTVSVNRAASNQGPFTLQLHDSKGALVMTRRFTSNASTIYTSGLSSGIYVVSLWGNNGKRIESERILIKY